MVDPLAEDATKAILRLLGLRIAFGTEQAIAEIVQKAMDDHYAQILEDGEGS